MCAIASGGHNCSHNWQGCSAIFRVLCVWSIRASVLGTVLCCCFPQSTSTFLLQHKQRCKNKLEHHSGHVADAPYSVDFESLDISVARWLCAFKIATRGSLNFHGDDSQQQNIITIYGPNGHLEVLQWVRANRGEWTSDAANWAAANGHLEVLQWIRANGGEWTNHAANWAAENGYLKVLQWIRANGGEWTSDAADWAARNGHLEVLQWIWTNGGKWTDDAADGAAQNQHLEVFEWICAHDGLVNSVIVDLK